MPDTKITLRSIVLDCPDAWALAGFYSAMLGWDRHCEDPEWVSVGRMGTLPFLLFQEVEDYRPPVWPEQPGQQQKSIHLDFAVRDLAAAVALAEHLGARRAPVQYDSGWTVMFDPAGHPFCLNQV